MTNIEKRHIINSNNLSEEFYFYSLLQEAYTCGLLNKADLENIQLQCISLLAYKSERYTMGDSSSIRVETAESIMKSNLYTIGLYLKSLSDADSAVDELKSEKISELYEKGRKLVSSRLQLAKNLYTMVQNNKLDTKNHSYNSTLSEKGIGTFFKLYNIDYEAHDFPANIDYQLCNPVNDLAGVEFIQKYLENLYFENEFCMNFASKNIQHLLYGYDKNYPDLLINIFEQVLTAALGCYLAGRDIRGLNIIKEDIQYLYGKLRRYARHELLSTINDAAKQICMELKLIEPSLQEYIEKSLVTIVTNIENALKINTLDKVFIASKNPDLEPKIRFESGVKMDDEQYRELVEELIRCRYEPDKLVLIKEKVKSLDDFEDILFDVQLEEKEVLSLLDTLGDVELAEMLRRHPFELGIQAVDLSEEEQTVRLHLEKYINMLSSNRSEKIFKMKEYLEI